MNDKIIVDIGVIFQGLLLTSVIGFGSYMTNGIGKLNDNVVTLTSEIAKLNTTTVVNSAGIITVNRRVDEQNVDIRKNREDITNLKTKIK